MPLKARSVQDGSYLSLSRKIISRPVQKQKLSGKNWPHIVGNEYLNLNHALKVCKNLVDQVCGEALEQVRNKQEAAREKIKYLNGVLEVVDGEIKALGDDLAEVIVKRDRAYSRIQELRKQRDDSVFTCPSVLR